MTAGRNMQADTTGATGAEEARAPGNSDEPVAQVPVALVVDAEGLVCPWPVLKARKALDTLASGAVIEVIATDPASYIDIPAFCDTAGHILLDQRRDGSRFVYRVRKGTGG
jgi:tRNA 2-thiouridine synthesizing protein A